jgi:hypothetical protein
MTGGGTEEVEIVPYLAFLLTHHQKVQLLAVSPHYLQSPDHDSPSFSRELGILFSSVSFSYSLVFPRLLSIDYCLLARHWVLIATVLNNPKYKRMAHDPSRKSGKRIRLCLINDKSRKGRLYLINEHAY